MPRRGGSHARSASVRRLNNAFTPSHRGGSGPPLVCLHGFMESWRSWELVLPALERRHDVLALTLAGHAGGLPLSGAPSVDLADAVERAMDDAGMPTAHLVGNSLGGYLALRLAERARTIVALAPAGGWGDDSWRDVLAFQAELHAAAAAAAPHAIATTPAGRRQATRAVVSNFEHIPADLVAHIIRALAACDARPLLENAHREGWPLEAERIECPVRIVWGTEDRLLPWPSAASRYRAQLPHADWVVLDGAGHAPQLDVPLEAAQLILGFTNP